MKKLLLVRHAHRDNSQPDKDNGLSEKGLKQAELLKDYLKEFAKEESITFIFSSAKKRCLETVEPIAKHLKLLVQEERDLYERQAHESMNDFLRRIERFTERWKYEGQGVWIACSHGDWLPLAVQMLTGARCEMKKGAAAEISNDAGEVFLTSLIQKF